MLIVRELLVRPARYSELRESLPGIATNLLANRLRELEAGGVVERSLNTTTNSIVYSLTPWGEELRAVVDPLVRWSVPLMVSGPRADDTFRPQWLVVALEALLEDARSAKKVTFGLDVEGALVTVTIDRSGCHVELDTGTRPQTVLRVDPFVALGLASGELPAADAIGAGVLEGDPGVIFEAFAPHTHQAATPARLA